jgi:hypothetical protein
MDESSPQIDDYPASPVEDHAPASPEFVMGFQEGQARARAGGQIMGSQIEGEGRLARLQQFVDYRQKDTQIERQFLSAFFEFRDQFNEADEVLLKDKFLSLKNFTYKNPVVYLLAEYVLHQGRGEITRVALHEALRLAEGIDQKEITEEDIIRYCRLLQR